MRFSALIPMACAIVAFILSMLCLFAGHKPGFMEDYDIVRLNTSTLGHVLVPNTTSSSGSTPTATSVGSIISSIVRPRSLISSIEGDLAGIEGDIADKLASELGIKQWYSLHLMDMCEGTFTPNATSKSAKLNISSCSNQTTMYHFNLQATLQAELEKGNLHINLSDIDWPSSIQDGLNDLNAALDATFVLYAIGIAAAGLAIFTSLPAVLLSGSRLVSLINWSISSLSFFTLLIASIIITVFQKKATHVINKYGNDIGAYAYIGKKYLAITWVAVAMMGVASVVWTVEFCVGRRNEKREYTEKRGMIGGKRNNRMSDDSEFARRI